MAILGQLLRHNLDRLEYIKDPTNYSSQPNPRLGGGASSSTGASSTVANASFTLDSSGTNMWNVAERQLALLRHVRLFHKLGVVGRHDDVDDIPEDLLRVMVRALVLETLAPAAHAEWSRTQHQQQQQQVQVQMQMNMQQRQQHVPLPRVLPLLISSYPTIDFSRLANIALDPPMYFATSSPATGDSAIRLLSAPLASDAPDTARITQSRQAQLALDRSYAMQLLRDRFIFLISGAAASLHSLFATLDVYLLTLQPAVVKEINAAKKKAKEKERMRVQLAAAESAAAVATSSSSSSMASMVDGFSVRNNLATLEEGDGEEDMEKEEDDDGKTSSSSSSSLSSSSGAMNTVGLARSLSKYDDDDDDEADGKARGDAVTSSARHSTRGRSSRRAVAGVSGAGPLSTPAGAPGAAGAAGAAAGSGANSQRRRGAASSSSSGPASSSSVAAAAGASLTAGVKSSSGTQGTPASTSTTSSSSSSASSSTTTASAGKPSAQPVGGSGSSSASSSGSGTPSSSSSSSSGNSSSEAALENAASAESEWSHLLHLPLLESFFLVHAPIRPPPRRPGLVHTSRAGLQAIFNGANGGATSSSTSASSMSQLTLTTAPSDLLGPSASSFSSTSSSSSSFSSTQLSSRNAVTDAITLVDLEAQIASVIRASPQSDAQFNAFVERHQRILSMICRKVPKMLKPPVSSSGSLRIAGPGMGSLNSLLWHPRRVLDFDVRRKFFAQCLRQAHQRRPAGSLLVKVRRETVFEDSCHQLLLISPNDLKKKLKVEFIGEMGIDAGGLTREFFLVLSRAIFNPNYALFAPDESNQNVFMPSRNSHWNHQHLTYFRFVGRFVGKAIYDGENLDCYFARSFYKHILGIPITFSDLEHVDPNYYKSLKWMLENPVQDVLDLTFQTEVDALGRADIVDLVRNGGEIAVTDENKIDYVHLMTDFLLTKSISKQLEAFLEGFHELIPRELISIFTPEEFELLMCGLPSVDVFDLKANTEYIGFGPNPKNHPVIVWFWELVAELDQEDLARLLLFVTGTSKVPVGGFRTTRPIRIQASSEVDKLPNAHTCFYQLDLPRYSSIDIMREMLLLALREGSIGFGAA